MNVSLNPRLARFVEEQVRAGRFSTPDDVVNGALARLQADEELSPPDTDALRAEINPGIEQANRGELAPWDPAEIEAEVERRFASEADSDDRANT